MTQRAQMVAASVHRPRLLVLDEPFSGLDPIGVQWALERIRTLNAEGATMRSTLCWNGSPDLNANPGRVWSIRDGQILSGFRAVADDGIRDAFLTRCSD